MNSVSVGIWARNGFDASASEVYSAVASNPNISRIFLLMCRPDSYSARGTKQFAIKWDSRVYQETVEDSFRYRPGWCKNRILRLATSSSDCRALVILSGSSVPQPGYLDAVISSEESVTPLLMTGKSLRRDGNRAPDICTIDILGNHITVPYEDYLNPLFRKDLYVNGFQQILNRPAMDLGCLYPDVVRLEDYKFCQLLKQRGAAIRLLPDVCIKLTDNYKEHDDYSGSWSSRDF